jgi:hypothetical protein
MDYGIAETGIARGSPPGTTTEVLRVGFPFAKIRVVSAVEEGGPQELAPSGSLRHRPAAELMPSGSWCCWCHGSPPGSRGHGRLQPH